MPKAFSCCERHPPLLSIADAHGLLGGSIIFSASTLSNIDLLLHVLPRAMFGVTSLLDSMISRVCSSIVVIDSCRHLMVGNQQILQLSWLVVEASWGADFLGVHYQDVEDHPE